MGVSIMMTPGPVGRNFGPQVSITPGFRSKATEVLRSHFSESPIVLVAEHDLATIEMLEDGASVYTSDDDNMWRKIHEALVEHGCVTIVMDY